MASLGWLVSHQTLRTLALDQMLRDLGPNYTLRALALQWTVLLLITNRVSPSGSIISVTCNCFSLWITSSTPKEKLCGRTSWLACPILYSGLSFGLARPARGRPGNSLTEVGDRIWDHGFGPFLKLPCVALWYIPFGKDPDNDANFCLRN